MNKLDIPTDSSCSDAKGNTVADLAPPEPAPKLSLKHNDRLSFDSIVGKLESIIARYTDDQIKRGLKSADEQIDQFQDTSYKYFLMRRSIHTLLEEVHKADPEQPLSNTLRERIRLEFEGPD
jgi:hypothetical protein